MINSGNEKLLYKLVIQFLVFCQGKHRMLEPHLAQIGKRLKHGATLHDVTAELYAMSRTLAIISRQTLEEAIPTVTENEWLHSDYILQRLDDLLTHSDVAPRFHQQTALLKQRLRTEINDSSYKKVIDSAIALLLNIKDYAVSEQKGIDVFLHDLSEQLSEIESGTAIIGESNQLSIDNRDTLNSAINVQLNAIKDTTQRADELSALKNSTSAHLDRLMEQLLEHKQQEDERQMQAQEQIALMTQKLQALETETETLRAKLKIEHDRALSDALTGLPNRMAYKDRAEIEFNRWKRYKAPLSLAIWDIDHFKRINDQYGHKAGDKTLALVGQLLLNNCRETDFVARYGGEEFVMLMPNTPAEQALGMTEQIRLMIEQCGFNSNGEIIDLTLSCGISEFTDSDQYDDVFVRADQALYQAKQAGRNRCAIYQNFLE